MEQLKTKANKHPQRKITNLFIWEKTSKKNNDLAIMGRPFSSIQRIW